jgi:hypothetical protein
MSHRRRGARDVELCRGRRAAFRLHQVEGFRAFIDVRNHNASAEATEISRVFLPDPARRAGDDDDFSLDVHVGSPDEFLAIAGFYG